jgi:hypothetical protein
VTRADPEAFLAGDDVVSSKLSDAEPHFTITQVTQVTQVALIDTIILFRVCDGSPGCCWACRRSRCLGTTLFLPTIGY